MSEFRLAEKPSMDAFTAMVCQPLVPEAALATRADENGVILKPLLIKALR